MRFVLPSIILFSITVTACSTSRSRIQIDSSPYTHHGQWYKGNTHTHTHNSDGDSPPEVVAQWYKDHDYDFLVLTDHNHLTHPDEAVVGDDSFLLIPGEEVSATFRSPFENTKPIHINGLDVDSKVDSISDQETLALTIQKNVDAIRSANGVPHINHPNFRWAFSSPELLQVENYNLLEIYNGHPLVNNEGNAEHIGMERVWDDLLTSGRLIYGIGVDDAHHFKGDFAPERSNPGRCWIMVRADSLETDSIMESIESGNFYFTTGPTINEIDITTKGYRIKGSEDYSKTEFIGHDGALLHSTTLNPARYTFQGTEQYVRAKVYGKEDGWAWTQPVFIELKE